MWRQITVQIGECVIHYDDIAQYRRNRYIISIGFLIVLIEEIKKLISTLWTRKNAVFLMNHIDITFMSGEG